MVFGWARPAVVVSQPDLEVARRYWANACEGWVQTGRLPEARGVFTVEDEGGVVLVISHHPAWFPHLIRPWRAGLPDAARRVEELANRLRRAQFGEPGLEVSGTGHPSSRWVPGGALSGPWLPGGGRPGGWGRVPPGVPGDLPGSLPRGLPGGPPPDEPQDAGPAILSAGIPPGDEEGAWRRALAAHGFRISRQPRFVMGRPLAPDLQFPEPPGPLRVKVASTPEELEAARKINAEGFGTLPQVARFFAPSGLVTVYLATWNGEPAGVASLWPFAGVAGVYGVATRRRLRRRGVATAVVQRLLMDAARAGFDLAVLDCLGPLVGHYARSGFRPVWRMLSYTLRV